MNEWLSVTDQEHDELVRCAREAYNEGRWVSYPSNYAWQVVVSAIIQKRAAQVAQVGEKNGE